MKLQALGKDLLDLVFPPRCAWCGRVVAKGSECTCDEEPKQLPDAPLDLAKEGKVARCLREAWACYLYAPPVSDAVIRVKFEEDASSAQELGRRMAQKFSACGLAERYDVLIPVPVSRKTRQKRGYNQSALLAKEIAARCGMPLLADALVKVRETPQQTTLGRAQRLTNVAGAYAVKAPASLQGRRVLLVDDVLTTGSTVDECAKTLLAAGAAACGAFCLTSAGRHYEGTGA